MTKYLNPVIGFSDGSVGAPTGAAQLPTILDIYHPIGQAPGRNKANLYQPRWNVSGVDYRTGINTGTVLKNPRTDTLPSGVTRDTANNIFSVNSNSVLVDAWDFSEGGGWTCDINAADATITNSRFGSVTGSGILKFEPVSSHRGTVRYCEFDQLGLSSSVAPLTYFADGLITVEWCYFNRAWPMHAQFTNGNGSSMAIIFRYNLLNNSGIGAPGDHGDFIQIFGGNFFVSSMDMSYNCVVQSLPAAQAATQGWSIQGSAIVTEIRNASLSNNTTIVFDTANVNYVNLFDDTWINGGVKLQNNYAACGPATWLLESNSAADGPFAGFIIQSGNVNMVTGTVL